MKKTMNKTTKNNFINYGIVIAIFVIVEILSGTGNLSRLLTGLLVPLCVYTIAAISLNLVVGFSGELSLGHAGSCALVHIPVHYFLTLQVISRRCRDLSLQF